MSERAMIRWQRKNGKLPPGPKSAMTGSQTNFPDKFSATKGFYPRHASRRGKRSNA